MKPRATDGSVETWPAPWGANASTAAQAPRIPAASDADETAMSRHMSRWTWWPSSWASTTRVRASAPPSSSPSSVSASVSET